VHPRGQRMSARDNGARLPRGASLYYAEVKGPIGWATPAAFGPLPRVRIDACMLFVTGGFPSIHGTGGQPVSRSLA